MLWKAQQRLANDSTIRSQARRNIIQKLRCIEESVLISRRDREEWERVGGWYNVRTASTCSASGACEIKKMKDSRRVSDVKVFGSL